VTSLEKALRDFAQFAAKLKGDEKSEAQTFLFHLLAASGHDSGTLPGPGGSTFEYRARARRFILQCVVAIFAEEIGLLPQDIFTRLLDECRRGASAGQTICQRNKPHSMNLHPSQ
jgi:hypothetical protein